MPRRSDTLFRNPLLLAAFSLFVIVGGGWVGDMLKGDCLEFRGARSCATQSMDLVGLSVGLFVFFVGAIGLYRAGRAYLPVRHLRSRKDAPGRPTLIAAISTFTRGTDVADDGTTVIRLPGSAGPAVAVTLTGNIDADIEALGAFNNNIQHFLRAVRPHAKAGLQQVFLLGSAGNQGSARLRTKYAAVLRQYAPDITVHVDSPAIDFENIDDMYKAIADTLKGIVGGDETAAADIVVDVTGGQKTASIAAALSTLKHENLEFQYVSTLDDFDVLTFNMITETAARIGA